jgi:hypothetical protein
MENWKAIEDYEGHYEVSDLGNVRSVDRVVLGRDNSTDFRKGRLLKPGVSNRGYLRVVLVKDGNKRNYPVHRLVAAAFVPNPNNLPQVNHKEGNKKDNRASELEWCTQLYNNRHARLMGLNVTKKGELNHSYGFNNKQSHRVISKITGEIKVIADLVNEYPQWGRRYINQMIAGKRNNKTSYLLHA